jgi:hypothetical protein
MDPNISIHELETIVELGTQYVGPHGDALAHVYGTAAMLRDLSPTERQRQKLADVVAEFRAWFTHGGPAREDGVADPGRQRVRSALADLKQAYRPG